MQVNVNSGVAREYIAQRFNLLRAVGLRRISIRCAAAIPRI
jgi:hypothetical protein